MKGEKVEDEDSSTERWLVSYADFITLMMVLFMMLYGLQLVKGEGVAMSKLRQADAAPATTAASAAVTGTGAALGASRGGAEPTASEIEAGLLAQLQSLRDSGQIKLVKNAKGLEIEINARLLFSSGDARVLAHALPVIKSIAKPLRDYPRCKVLVEGHTDSQPISNARFESNWELSSARAGAVVRYLEELGIAPSRLAAMGRADNVPAALGDSPEALAANRRVTILVQY